MSSFPEGTEAFLREMLISNRKYICSSYSLDSDLSNCVADLLLEALNNAAKETSTKFEVDEDGYLHFATQEPTSTELHSQEHSSQDSTQPLTPILHRSPIANPDVVNTPLPPTPPQHRRISVAELLVSDSQEGHHKLDQTKTVGHHNKRRAPDEPPTTGKKTKLPPFVQRFRKLRAYLKTFAKDRLPEIPEVDSGLFPKFKASVQNRDAYELGKLADEFFKLGDKVKFATYVCSYYLYLDFRRPDQRLAKEFYLQHLYRNEESPLFGVDALNLGDKLFCLIGENESLLNKQEVLSFPFYRIGLLDAREE